MALSLECVEEHITQWENYFAGQFYPHRTRWPAHLFHHAPMENAIAILQEGVLRSRNDPLNRRLRDVAAPGVIDARGHAHDRVRLYFRPKNPTQFNIEGIRKPGECRYGEDTHCPVLVMFALNARNILCRPDVSFSDRNMQIGAACPGKDEDYFKSIPFSKVYHEGPYSDPSIKDHRCAEVMTASPLPLAECLTAVFFRSEPEKEMALHLLGNRSDEWAHLFRVSDDLKFFERKFTLLEEIALTPEGVTFRCNAREDRRNIEVEITVRDADGRLVGNFANDDIQAMPPNAARWIFNVALPEGRYLVECRLERHQAFIGYLQVGGSLF